MKIKINEQDKFQIRDKFEVELILFRQVEDFKQVTFGENTFFNKFNSLFNQDLEYFKVIGIYDEGITIVTNPKRYTGEEIFFIRTKEKFEFGKDYLFVDVNRRDNTLYIFKDLMEQFSETEMNDFRFSMEKFLSGYDKKFNLSLLIELEESENIKDILTAELNTKINVEDKRRKEAEMELLEQKKKEKEKTDTFQKVSNSDKEIVKFDNVTIEKNKLKYWGQDLILTNGTNIKDVFTLEEIKKINAYNHNKDFIRHKLLKLRESFDLVGKYKFVFKGSKGVEFNGVSIAVNKVDTILNNLKDYNDTAQIELINSLSLMKIDLLEIKELTSNSNITKVNELKIPISVTTNDKRGNLFDFEMLNKKTIISWDRAKDLFFSKGTSRTSYNRLDVKKIMDIYVKDLGGSREDFLKDLRKLSILKELVRE